MALYCVGNYEFELGFNLQVRMPPAAKRVILPAVKACLSGLPKKVLAQKLNPGLVYELNVAVVGPQTMQRLNGNYRKKDKPTDVLSFSRIEGIPTPHPEIGDVILCWKIAKAQAIEFKTTMRDELCRLTIHGVLHLFGYDHETNQADARRMFALQNKILRSLRSEPRPVAQKKK